MYAPFTPGHWEMDLDRFFGRLTRYLERAMDSYKVRDIQDLKRALGGGCEQSKVDREAEGKVPIKQLVLTHDLKKKSPLLEKRIHLPGLGSVGGIKLPDIR